MDEIRSYLVEEINRKELMSKRHENVCRVLNYTDHSFIAISTISHCASISAFASLAGIPTGITSSTIGLKICGITAAIKMYKSIIMEKRKKHNKIVLIAKSKLNGLEALISKTLVDSNISHDEFVLINKYSARTL